MIGKRIAHTPKTWRERKAVETEATQKLKYFLAIKNIPIRDPTLIKKLKKNIASYEASKSRGIARKKYKNGPGRRPPFVNSGPARGK